MGISMKSVPSRTAETEESLATSEPVEAPVVAAPAVVFHEPTDRPLIVSKGCVGASPSSKRNQAVGPSSRTWYSQYEGRLMRLRTLKASEAVTTATASEGFVYCWSHWST